MAEDSAINKLKTPIKVIIYTLYQTNITGWNLEKNE